MTSDRGGDAIDIVVCTRDRQSMLGATLEALLRAADRVPGTRILVVDNGSRDGTRAFLSGEAARDGRILPLGEPQPGLYHARAAAIRASDGAILLFVDDDVIVPPDLLSGVRVAFRDPSVGVVGGGIEGLMDGPLPDWFAPRFLRDIPVMGVDGDIEDCRYPRFPPGVCLAVRRAPCLDYYLAGERRQAELGYGGGAISGRPAVGGDDTDLCEIYVRAGFRVIRVAGIVVLHRVIAGKLTRDWVLWKYQSDGRLRVRMARLRGRAAVGGETARLLAAFPALVLVRAVVPFLPPARAMVVRALLAKSLGGWRETLFGPKGLRLPYPGPAGGDAPGTGF